jgi:hypothetical protein
MKRFLSELWMSMRAGFNGMLLTFLVLLSLGAVGTMAVEGVSVAMAIWFAIGLVGAGVSWSNLVMVTREAFQEFIEGGK